jgi:hypothetical protein
MVVAGVLDFPGVLLDDGKALPFPNPDAADADADLIELLPLSVGVGAQKL